MSPIYGVRHTKRNACFYGSGSLCPGHEFAGKLQYLKCT